MLSIQTKITSIKSMANSSYIQKTSEPLFLTDDSVGGIDVAADARGNFVVVWQTQNNIEFQRYNRKGSATGDRVTVGTPNGSTPTSPAIAMNSKGDFVITYDLIDPQRGNRQIDAQIFNSSGEKKGDSVFVTNNEIDNRNPDVAINDNGRFLVTWEQYNNPQRGTIALNYYDNKGKLIDNDQVTSGFNDSYEPAIAIVPKASSNNVSGILSFSQDSRSTTDGFDVLYQVLTGGNYSGGELNNVLNNPQGDQGQPAVGIDSKGNATISWSDKFSSSVDNVYLIKRANDGELTSQNVSQNTDEEDNSSAIAMASDGNFLVAYRAEDDEEIKLQQFNTKAETVGEPLTTSQLQSNPALGISPNGKYLILAGVDNDNQGGVLLYENSKSNSSNPNIGVDLNQDGKSDILWRNQQNGENRVWLMDGLNLASTESLTREENLNWYIGGVGDFNGDGKDDLIWANRQTRAVGVWYMDGTNRIGTGSLPRLNSRDLEVKGVGDFNSDGSEDLVVRNKKTGANQIWYMDGSDRVKVGNFKTQTNTRYDIYGIADFNNDGKPDVLFRDQTRSGRNQVWLMNNNDVKKAVNITTERNLDFYIGGTGDFNQDGKADIIFGNRTTGANQIWLMNGFEDNRISIIDRASITSESNLNWEIVNS